MTRFLFTATVALAAFLPAAAGAQTTIEGRVDRLEREMRAVQRKVFPGGAGGLVEPQITPPQSPADLPGTPATSVVTDLTARVNALESQVATLTGQVEQNGYQLRQLEEAFNAYKRATEARLKAVEGAAPAPPAQGGEDAGPATTPPASANARGYGTLEAQAGKAPAKAAARPAATNDPARAQLLKAVQKPSTGDPAEDEYIYGYRLWEAKLYPEAEAQLKKVVSTYPKHRRASYAQNLLGRVYLDEGKPSLASIAFYDNYKKMPDGERAPDSLLYLAKALVQLKKPADACKVYDELSDVYADRITASMKAEIAQGRATAKCK